MRCSSPRKALRTGFTGANTQWGRQFGHAREASTLLNDAHDLDRPFWHVRNGEDVPFQHDEDRLSWHVQSAYVESLATHRASDEPVDHRA